MLTAVTDEKKNWFWSQIPPVYSGILSYKHYSIAIKWGFVKEPT